ncbi:AI-2E family transporter [Microvirga antarctica]|uniref:AI-2E family transporter n=1 Tax=Microvirga antarctica TaxID=2819233 RepID=UPI001B31547C|nr:AI-2E family transporter [Microvirga antarctica]
MFEGRLPDRQQISTLVLTGGVLFGLFLCYLLAVPFLPALVWSFTLAVLFGPVYARVLSATNAPGLSAAIMVAVVAVIVVVPAILVIGTLLTEAVRNATLVSAMVDADSWTRWVDAHPRLAPALRWLDLPELVKAPLAWLAGWSGTFVSVSLSGLISLLLTFYFLFYFFRDQEAILAATRGLLPLSSSEFAVVADRIVNTIFATILGTAAVAALQGALGGAMFWWLGLPAPLLWGVLMGLLAVVPFLGAFVIWAPTAAVLAIQGELGSAAVLTLWGTLVVGVVDNVVYPILVGKRLMLHTVASFIAIAGGLLVFGTPGVVLGPLVVAISLALLDIWRRRIPPDAKAAAGEAKGIQAVAHNQKSPENRAL